MWGVNMENKKCILDDNKICDNCGECDKCDLDPNKICDNCGKCLDEYNTDEKGFVHVPIDKIIAGDEASLEDFYTMAGLVDEEDEEDECDCCCDHDHKHNCNCHHDHE